MDNSSRHHTCNRSFQCHDTKAAASFRRGQKKSAACDFNKRDVNVRRRCGRDGTTHESVAEVVMPEGGGSLRDAKRCLRALAVAHCVMCDADARDFNSARRTRRAADALAHPAGASLPRAAREPAGEARPCVGGRVAAETGALDARRAVLVDRAESIIAARGSTVLFRLVSPPASRKVPEISQKTQSEREKLRQ